MPFLIKFSMTLWRQIKFKIKIQITVMNSIRKGNRALLPLNQNQLSSQLLTNYTPKGYADVPKESHAFPHRQFPENNASSGRKYTSEEHLSKLSIPQLNVELDKNLDDIISFISKRKILVAAKKSKILQEAQQNLKQVRCHPQNYWSQIAKDEDFLKITGFCHNPSVAVKMLGRIIQTVPEIKGPRIDEQQRSQQFWARNRKLENDIDSILDKLKTIDKQLQKENGDVFDICKELDTIEDTLKSFVGNKSHERVSKVQPLFNSKKKNYDILNRKLKERQISKDKKIQFIKRIKYILQELKRTREDRLEEIASFFGIDNTWEFDQMNIKDQGDFANAVQELLKLRQKDLQLQLSQNEVLHQMDIIQKEQQKVHSQLLKILSDQAKSFHNFNSVQTQRVKNTSIMSLFQYQTQNFSFRSIDPKQYLKKFKDVKNFFRKFLEEDTLLKQGLVKTSQTTKTFVNLLRTTQNQKQRRHELLSLLETCIRKRADYEQKRDQMRNLQFEQSRNDQEMTRFEQDLQAVLTDGDLQGYKKIGNAMGKCEQQKARLVQVKQLIEKQMQSMDRDVISIANRIKQEYGDILSDILPSDAQYSLKSGQDIKKLRNQLRRMYKRLGLLSNQ